MKLTPEIDYSVINMGSVGPEGKQIDIRYTLEDDREQSLPERTDYLRAIEQCANDWAALQDFRDRRQKNRKYYRGDQWHEMITNPDNESESITEEQHIMNQGKVPLKQNIIRQIVRNIIGQYRTNPSKSMVIARDRAEAKKSEMLGIALDYAHELNQTKELDARLFEERCVSGGAIQKLRFAYWPSLQNEELFIENINPARVFYNSDLSDPRLMDLKRVGMIIDSDLDSVIAAFAKDEKDEDKIKSWYAMKDKNIPSSLYDAHKPDRIDNLNFYVTEDPNKCRVIEVWELKGEWKTYVHDYAQGRDGYVDIPVAEIAKINKLRILNAAQQGVAPEQVPLIESEQKYVQYWEGMYLTPYGQCLYKSKSVYLHNEHPFAMHLYPMLDGEVWGLIEDFLDQQKYINRLITLYDFIMGVSAKGVLLFPEELKPDDMDMDDIAEEWSKFNGVIKFKAKPGYQLPQQISRNLTNIGIFDMLNMQVRLLQEISGVSAAIQGQTANAGTPSSLYAQQAQNSVLNIKDFVESFNSFKKQRDYKACKLIQQFYKDKKYINIAGAQYSEESKMFDPEKVKDLQIDIVVTQGMDTPAYRQLIDDTLMEFMKAGFIDLEMFLENSSIPFADNLLNTIRARKQQQQPVLPGDIQGQLAQVGQMAQEKSDPRAVQLINKMMAA